MPRGNASPGRTMTSPVPDGARLEMGESAPPPEDISVSTDSPGPDPGPGPGDRNQAGSAIQPDIDEDHRTGPGRVPAADNGTEPGPDASSGHEPAAARATAMRT